MTNSYLKMRASATAAGNRSKSVDFSEELLGLPCSHPQPRSPRVSTEKTGWNVETLIEHRDDEINGEIFGVVLGIRHTVSPPTEPTKGFRSEIKRKVGSSSAKGKYSAVKRVFSMRRSASVSERYCRIHDQSVKPTAYFEDDDAMDEDPGSPMKPVKNQQQKGGKIIKACKRLFNLK